MSAVAASAPLDALQTLFGERMSARESDRLLYHRDLSPVYQLAVRDGVVAGRPEAVVWPETVQDVAALLRLANEHGLPVVPFGAGSGVVGGAVAARGGVVCDLKRMRRLVHVDERSGLVTAEAGILGEDLERALNARGFTLGHFPASIYASTLGGWLATRAAGQMSTKYGKIEDMIVSLEAVLPSGRILHTKTAPRSATGPDLDQLLVGSEGTLAVITRATLRMHRLPEARLFASAAFERVDDGLEAVRKLLRAGVRPAVVRLYDEVDAAVALKPLGLEAGGNLLILGFEGRRRLVEAEARAAAPLLAAGRGLGAKPGEWWYAHRFQTAYRQSVVLADSRMVVDSLAAGATWTNVRAVYEGVKAALDGFATAHAHFSHAYPEGISVDFSLLGDAGARPPTEYHAEILRRALDAVVAAGGGISHHHGVGLVKAPWLGRELGGLAGVFARLKRELDPNNILNPGKMGLP